MTTSFPKTERILKQWLDNAQRHSGFECEKQFEEAMNELRAADDAILEYCHSLDV